MLLAGPVTDLRTSVTLSMTASLAMEVMVEHVKPAPVLDENL